LLELARHHDEMAAACERRAASLQAGSRQTGPSIPLALKACFARAFAHLETDMANYFNQFSCLLPVGSAANLEAALAIYHAYAVERAEAEEPLGLVAEAYPSHTRAVSTGLSVSAVCDVVSALAWFEAIEGGSNGFP
jgi:hypothetical protein